MPSKKNPIPFFTDQNVPDSVGSALKKVGHSLTRLRDVMETDTPDPVIVVACSSSGHVLISHDNDFRQISKRLKITQRHYQKKLHRIHLRCPEPESSRRIIEAMSLIEFEWLLVQQDRTLVIEIKNSSITTRR